MNSLIPIIDFDYINHDFSFDGPVRVVGRIRGLTRLDADCERSGYLWFKP